MSMNKSKGNMYDWVTHTHSHLRGKCYHNCGYCYVQSMSEKYSHVKDNYSNTNVTIKEKELNVNYGKNKIIFIEHMNDLFAKNVPDELIEKILNHCNKYPESKYVLQTKNPLRYLDFVDLIPDGTICGTTIESNIKHSVMGNTPEPIDRVLGIRKIKDKGFDTFITIEPILDFNLIELYCMIYIANPSFVNIGADSKGHGLNEPDYEKIMDLYDLIVEHGIEVRKKNKPRKIKK